MVIELCLNEEIYTEVFNQVVLYRSHTSHRCMMLLLDAKAIKDVPFSPSLFSCGGVKILCGH